MKCFFKCRIVVTFVFATYFTSAVAKNAILGTHQWGNAIALSGLIIAICGPIFGAIADYSGHRKIWLFFFTLMGVISTSLLWIVYPTPEYIGLALLLIIISTVGFEIASVFYNAFLVELAPPGYLGRLSGWGWGFGYIGGIFCLVIALFGFVEGKPAWLPLDTLGNVRICGPLVAIWVVIFSLPLFLFIYEKNTHLIKTMTAIRRGLRELKNTLLSLRPTNPILIFLIARMIYTDGLNTLFAFGGIYAAGTFGMSVTEVIEFGIVLNLTAGLGAAIFAWVDDYLGSKTTLLISIMGMTILGILILLVHTKTHFWMLAPTIGLFVGPMQAASRSFMARLANPNQINEMFGLYAFSGKATAFLGAMDIRRNHLLNE